MSAMKAIECAISPGMFSDEWLVKFQIGTSDYAFFVPQDAVKILGSDRGLLRVEVLDSEDPPVVIVPNEGRTAIGVLPADLIEA